MSINNLNTYLNVRDAHLRVVSGNVYAQAMNIGGINVETAHGLQSVSDTGNVTSNTLQFSNATTGFVTTANAQIGRDLVVTGNATVSKELTVTSNAIVSSNLNVSDDLIVTNNILASNNLTVTGNLHVTTIMSDSNVVAEYTGPHDRPLRKYPEVALTQNDESSTSGYVASASHPDTGEEPYFPYRAFDGVNTTHYHTPYPNVTYSASGIYNGSHKITDVDNVDHDGEWLKIQLPKAIKVEYMKFMARTSYQNRFPNKISILGSNDDSNWHLFLRDDNVPLLPVNPTFHTIHINATTKYKYYALVIREISHSGAPDTNGQVSQWELYGHEEGSGSLDTTLKTVYNVPATTGTQLEVYYDGQDYTGVTSTVNDKVGTATNATITNTNNEITFDSTYKAWTFGGTDTRTSNFQSSALPSNFSGDQVHSVALWFKCDIVSSDTLFSITQPSDPWEDPEKVISVRFSDASGGLRYLFWSNDIQYDGIEAKITNDIWYHLCVTYSGGGGTTDNKKLYLNGNEIHYTSTSGTYFGNNLSLPSGSVIRLGSRVQETTRFFGSIANFRLYSKALNADQVKELYDYQKDYFLGSKSQVTLYKGHLGIGVTEPSGQLELAGDERIQEYPPGRMNDYETLIPGHGVFTASASSGWGNYAYKPWGAFSKDTSVWISGNPTYNVGSGGNDGTAMSADTFKGINGSWLKLKLPYTINLKRFKIQGRHGSNERFVDATIYASTDDNNWDKIRSIQMPTSYTYETGVNFNAPNTSKYYDYFLIHITRVQTGTDQVGYANIGEWRLFGTPGPTTLDKGSLTLGRSLDVPRVSRYDVDTETPRPEKLVLDYDTTVNSSPTDISGNGTHGTFYNGATYSAVDKAFSFNNTQGGIRAETTNFDASGKHSFVAWMNFESFGHWYGLYGIGTKDGSASNFTIYTGAGGSLGGTGGFRLESRGGGRYDDRVWSESQKTNKWYHVAVTWDGTGGLSNVDMYIDLVKLARGGANASATSSITLPTDRAVRIGADAREFNGAGAGSNFNGLISNPKFYSEKLEFSEIKKLYNLGRTGRSMVISDTAVGIGKAPEAQLDVRGNLNVDGVITNQQRPAFYVWRDGTGNNVEAIGHGGGGRLRVTGAITNWDSKRVDTAGTFDLSNGRYNIPVSGLYMFIGAGVYRYQGSGNAILEATFFVNGSNANVRGISYNRGTTTSEHHTVTITFMRFMNAGDYVEMGLHECQSNCDFYYGDNLGYFSGYLLG